ncbi:PAS domain S-box-containing protein [Desulfacinum hydrothermale DSM 13146]|uniref:histidine kinase n=1 Tax=Desulfacinum hydrothermale DSM 13146 TaxID=1121390 RepID=A0A1W1X1I3_9BACT|nr:ATP-binding protein [Desulfacinum hydrothermale]SMC17802.1 PAS domain S-box-containing protein [Desulfacinum hydrothermale DSM 13146]
MIRRMRFRTKIYCSIIALLLLFGVSLAVVISRIATRSLLEENKKRGAVSALNLAARVTEPMLGRDFLTMKNLVDELTRSSPDVSYGFVLDRAGVPLVHTFQGGFPVALAHANEVADDESFRVRLLTDGSSRFYDIAAPVLVSGDRLGTVRIGMSREKVSATLNELLGAILLTTALGVGIAALVGTGLARTVTRRVALLRRSAEEIIKGNLDVATAPRPAHMCWELMDCDRSECPAHGDERRRCWYLAGTLCPLCVEGEYAKKIESCRKCKVFQTNSGDELQDLAEYFDVMALALGDRMRALEAAEQRLGRQQQVFRTILEVTPDIVCLQDRESRYQAVSKAFCRFFGKQEEEILGRTDFDLFHSQAARKNREEDLLVMQEARPLQMEKRVTGAQEQRWFHVVKTPVFDEQRNVIGVLCNERDITDFKELQERIAESQKLESIGQLAAGIAHEINTPLGIILGYVQLMLEDFPEDSREHQDLRLMEKHCRVCRKIVADLLRFSRHTESIKEPLDLNEVLAQVLALVEHSFSLDRVLLERDFADSLPLVHGDREKLEQVFMNLLNNAYQAIGSNGRIRVTTDSGNGQVRVIIADDGPGIPPEIRGRIFDPFFTTKGIGQGTGLGLSVTFGIVKDHGGTIEVETLHESELEEARAATAGNGQKSTGATFICRFPIHSAAPPDDTAVPHPAQSNRVRDKSPQ